MNKYSYVGSVLILLLLGVFTVTIMEDRITIDVPSDVCDKKLTFIVHEDYSKLKCGNSVVSEWKEYLDYYRTYGNDTWINDWRKTSSIKLSVLDYSPDYFVVRKSISYYKGRSGTDGILFVDYVFTKDKVKWSYTLNASNQAAHRIRVKMVSDNTAKYGFDFVPDDATYIGTVDGEYHYYDSAGHMFVDPMIRIATEGPYQWTYNQPFNNASEVSMSESSVSVGWNDTATFPNTKPHPEASGLALLKWWTMNLTMFLPNSTTWPNLSVSTAGGTQSFTIASDGSAISYASCPNAASSEKYCYNYANGTNWKINSSHEYRNLTVEVRLKSSKSAAECPTFGAWAGLILVNSTDTINKNALDWTYVYTCGTAAAICSGEITANVSFVWNTSDSSIYVYVNDTYYATKVKGSSGAFIRLMSAGGDLTTGNCYQGETYTANATLYKMHRYVENTNENITGIIHSTNITVGTNYTRVNITGKIWDGGNNSGNVTCNVSQDNSTWFELNSVGDNKLFAQNGKYFFYRCLLDNNGASGVGVNMSEINFTFAETVTVSNVAVVPSNPYINDTVWCNYTFYNSSGGTGNNNSNVSWYVNGINVLNNSASITNTLFDQLDNVSCSVLPFDGSVYGVVIASSNVTINYSLYANLTIQGYTTAKKWESGTTPLINVSAVDSIDGAVISTEEVCLSIDLHDYGTNFSCGNGTVLYNFTIPYVEQTVFNDSSSSVSVQNNGSFYFEIRNRSEIINGTVDVFGVNDTWDAWLELSGNVTPIVYFRGNLSGSSIYENRFDSNLTSVIYSLFTSADDSHNILVSTAGNFSDNVTLTVTASKANPEELDYEATWVNASNFTNYTGSVPTFMVDPISVSDGTKWNANTDGGGTAGFDSITSSQRSLVSTYSHGSASAGTSYSDTDTQNSWVNSQTIVMNSSKNRVDFNYSCSVGGTYSDSGYGSAYNIGNCYLQFVTDNSGGGATNLLRYYKEGLTTCLYDGCSGSGIMSLRKVSASSWQVYEDGVYVRTVTAPSGSLELRMYTYCLTDASKTTYGDGSSSAWCDSSGYVYDVKYGGVGVNYSTSNNTFTRGNYSFTSVELLNSSPNGNTDSVIATWSEFSNDYCNVDVFVSANNGTNWEETGSGTFHTFSNAGTQVRYKIELNQSQNDSGTCGIYDFSLLVSTDYPENVSFYLGGTGYNYSYFYNGILNETNTPLSISMTSEFLQEYIDDTCSDDTTCTVPLLISVISSSSGRLNVSNVTLKSDLSDVYLGSNFDNYLNSCVVDPCVFGINVNGSDGGNITFSDLGIKYLGSGNITVTSTTNKDNSWCEQNLSNESTDCGGLNTGDYLCDGNWSETFVCNNAKDEDWSTYGSQFGTAGNWSILYSNWSKNSSFTRDLSYWEVGDFNVTAQRTNLTIPQDCWEQEPIQFKVRSSRGSPLGVNAGQIYWECYNGTDFETLRSLYDGASFWRIYEQKMHFYEGANINTSLDMVIRYSPYTWGFVPSSVTSWDVYPSSRNAKNVQPFGQTATIPIYNITSAAVEDDTDVYMMINNTIDSCFKIFVDTNNVTSNVTLETNVDKVICDNLGVLDTCNVWMYVNLTSCSVIGLPNFEVNTLCSNCSTSPVDALYGD